MLHVLVVAFATVTLFEANVLAATPSINHPAPEADIDWDSFGFGLNGVRTDIMWVNTVSVDDEGNANYSNSCEDCLSPMGTLQLSPTSTVLNYGQGLFEGTKAFRRMDGSIAMFRPDRNAARMQQGASRFLMPSVPTDVFVQAATAVVRANARWVPPFGKGALYLRPLLMGTGEGLGVNPSSECTFCIYCSPVGNYFKGGLKSIRLQAVRGFSRAAPGGSGAVKASGNYASAFLVQKQVKTRGYDDVLCLDAVTGEAIEEAGASNFFAVFPNNTIITPSLDSKTILPGVTRASVMELAHRECGYTVREGRLTLDDLKEACEAFCCGTGASITPIASVNVTNVDGSEDVAASTVFGDGNTPGPLTRHLYKILLDLQTGADKELCSRYENWIHIVEPQ